MSYLSAEDRIFAGLDSWTAIKVITVLVPAVIFVWIITTVTALHRRDVYFWDLSSTWATVIACPLALVIMSTSAWSGLQDPNAPFFQTPILAGAGLYGVVFAYGILYNYNATKSATLAISTSMLQQLAVLGVMLLFLRWSGDEVNRDRHR